MARQFAKHFIAMGALLTSTAVLACADGGCEGGFNLVSKDQTCQGRAMLAPGNDSRINLMFLLNDRGGRSMAGLAPPREEVSYSYLDTPFLDWRLLREALYPTKDIPWETRTKDYSGTRCQSFAAGTAALTAAMAANRGLPAAERTALLSARAGAEEVCKTGTAYDRKYKAKSELSPLPVYSQWPSVSSAAGREFLTYLQAADAFYGDDFVAARKGFVALAGASDPWLKETASYTLIRVEYAAAQAPAMSDYGDFEVGEKVDRAAVTRGLQALTAYLKGWPRGRYAASAQGLLRRGLWLGRQYETLGGSYARALETAAPGSVAAAELVEEIDTKILFNEDAKGAGISGPILLAAKILTALRDTNYADEGPAKPSISAAQIDALAPQFAGQPVLFSYLQATHAFYYGRDYKRVLQLIPDDARRAGQNNLSFSRQMLRGMALAALNDRNEAGFWQELIPGAKGLWQRPLAELGLAMSWERSGQLGAVFAAGSPVTDSGIRGRLITYSAGPTLLRSITQRPANPAGERDLALYTLLASELVYGQFEAFTGDVNLPVADPKSNAALFTTAKVSDGYPCAPLAVTVAALAKNPLDVAGRLCLGDFYRLHGVDALGDRYAVSPRPNELGGAAKGFGGKVLTRGDFYTAIIADPKAVPNDKAYALYRAVMCYAPSKANACGNADVSVSQRKAWFDRLKRDYPQSPWAKKLRYYW